MYGINGKVLKVDLTAGTFEVETPDEIFYRTYHGGSCLACYYLLKECSAGVDPLGPDNVLVLASGPLVGSGIPGANRFSVAAISPLTGCYGEAEAGGWFSTELKRAGFDALVIKGRSPFPVYLYIKEGKPELRDAGAAWGKGTGDTEEIIRRDLGNGRVRIAAIGPAGENLVRYACVVNHLKHTNGRSGMGAVMGSKNLKAVAVQGRGNLPVKDEIFLRQMIKWYAKNFMDHPIERVLHEGGTIGWDVTELDEAGILPTRNFKSGSFEGAGDICGKTFHDIYFIKSGGCEACPINCKRVSGSNGRYKVDPKFGGPEYETAGAFGSLCGVSNLEAICKAHELCNDYALDTISTGSCIAFAMECFEKGYLTTRDVDGLDLRFGNHEAVIHLIPKIAMRQEFGDFLAEGTLRMAKKIGKGSESFAMQVKGQEMAMHEPRGKSSLAFAYALSSSGANHTEGPHDYLFMEGALGVSDLPELGILEPVAPIYMGPEKIRQFKHMQMTWNVFNTLGMCIFTAGPGKLLHMSQLPEAVRAATGWDTNLWEIMKLAERTVTIKRVVSVREGIRRRDDTLPDRLFEPLEGGLLKGNALNRKEFEEGLDLYYEMVGWDRKTGIPLRGKLVELGIGWVDDHLREARGAC
jgi:aldehyde:ferredoxin oxidoreductase